MRFQNEMDCLTDDVKPSIAQFMAFVHGSVNEMSKVSPHIESYTSLVICCLFTRMSSNWLNKDII